MKKIYAVLIAVMATASVWAQVTTNGGSGLAATYPSLASAITALNAATINGPVVITAASVNETAPAGGYVITVQGSAANTIEINSTGSVITANGSQAAGSLTDAVFKLVGADYVTIKGFTIRENAGNTTTDDATNNMTEWGIALLYSNATNGAQNITLQNNSISLSKTYQNSFGIYSSTAHSSTDAVTIADITAATGSNDNLKVYSCTISNVNTPIAVVSAPAYPGLGLDIGGSSAATTNTLSDWGLTATFSAFARVAAAVTGILATNQIGVNISYNNITSSTEGNNSGALRGIYVNINGALSYPATVNTTDINHNTIALTSNVSTIPTGNPLIGGIRNMIGDANSTVNINYNNFTKIDNIAVPATGNDTIIGNSAAAKVQNINYNEFTNLEFKNNGSASSYVILISLAGTLPAGAEQNSSYNRIVGTLTRNASVNVGTMYGIQCSGTTTALDAVHNWTYNNFSNVTISFGSFIGFINTDGSTSVNSLNKNISYNTLTNIAASRGVQGISSNNGSNGTGHVFRRNTFTNFTATASSAIVQGISTGVSSSNFQIATVDSNLIDNLSSALGSASGINFTSFNGTVSHNSITRLFANSTGLYSCYGIQLSSTGLNANTNTYNNKIGNLENAGNHTGLAVYGIYKVAGTAAGNFNVYNNRIGDLNAPNSTSLNNVVGISIGTNGTTSNAISGNIIYNTIYLSGALTKATSGSSCVMWPGGTSTGTLNLRNNILVNLCTPGTEAANSEANGVSACLRHITGTGAAPSNYATTSNNNLFWANPTAGTNNHLTYAEGWSATTMTAKQNTLADWQSFLSGATMTMDNASVSENTAFQSLVATDENFLKINPGYIQLVSNAGASITAPITVASDFEGNARNASTPDIGADEFSQDPGAVPLPVTMDYFNGRKSGTDNLLSWVTNTEINNKGFEVQRSADGVHFTNIGFVFSKAAGGNSSNKISYSFTDRNVAAGNFYYRLVQQDLNGRAKMSGVVLIADRMANAGIAALYPNPARSFINLSIQATAADKIQIMISDANGKQVKMQYAQVLTGSNTIGVDVSKLPAGFYNMTILMKEMDKAVTQRFMKQ